MPQQNAKGRSRILVAAGLAAVAASGWWQARAQACSWLPPPCIEVPPEGATFPANAVAFRVVRPAPRGLDDPLALRTEEGNVAVAASQKTLANGELVFSPDQPLQPGRRYVLSYDENCFAGSPREIAFLATEAAAFPPSAGTLTVVARGLREVENQLDPRTGSAQRAAFVTLQLADTAESLPFRALRTYRLEVDGQSLDGPFEGYQRIYTLGRSPEILIQSFCRESNWVPGPCGGIVSLPAGRHRVKLDPHILGTPSNLPSLVQEIELSCDDRPPPAITSPRNAPGTPAAAPGPGDAAGAAGCSFTARREPPRALDIAVGLLALALLLRRHPPRGR